MSDKKLTSKDFKQVQTTIEDAVSIINAKLKPIADDLEQLKAFKSENKDRAIKKINSINDELTASQKKLNTLVDSLGAKYNKLREMEAGA